MAITVNINNLTLCHKGSDGVSICTMPDICKTPPNATPIPYSNFAKSSSLAKGTRSVFADGSNSIAKHGAIFASSSLDEPGTIGGIKSGTNRAEADFISHSFNVFFEKKPVCRLTDKMFMNHRNTVNLAGEMQGSLIPPDFSDKCKKIWAAIDKWMNSKRLPTQPGQKPQGLKGLVERWIEYAANEGGKGAEGKFARNHLQEYEKIQKKLQDDLERWDKNNCGDDDDLPPNARQYAAQVPELGPNKSLVPNVDGEVWRTVATGAVVISGIALTVIVVSRIIRCIPPLWPFQLSPI